MHPPEPTNPAPPQHGTSSAADSAPSNASPNPSPRHIWLLTILTLIAGMLLLRGFTPSDLLDNDQLKPAGYLIDIVADGRWLVQTDFFDNIASKPPLHTWIAALAATAIGPNEWALAVPGAIGMLLGCLAIWMIAARTLGTRAAWLASLAWLFSFFGFKHVWLARTDGLYAGLTALAIALAWRACANAPQRTRDAEHTIPTTAAPPRRLLGPWLWFWLALALATLTKGPLCIAFAAFAVLGLALTTPRPWLRGGHAIGINTLALLAGGWFIAAMLFGGQGVYDKLIGDELLGHAVGASKDHLREITIAERLWVFFLGLFKPTLYALWNTVPWSVAWAIGLWRTITRPANDPTERRLEMLCLAWLGLGIALLSVVPHQRPDHLLPLMPAAAILAGREISRWINGWSPARCRIGLIATAALAFTLAWLNYAVLVRDAWYIRHQEALQRLAAEIESRDDIPQHQLIFVDASAGLQFLLRNNNDRVPIEAAAARLATGEPGPFAIRDTQAFIEHFLASGGDPERLTVLAHARARGAAGRTPRAPEDDADDPSPLGAYRSALLIVVTLNADDQTADNHDDA